MKIDLLNWQSIPRKTPRLKGIKRRLLAGESIPIHHSSNTHSSISLSPHRIHTQSHSPHTPLIHSTHLPHTYLPSPTLTMLPTLLLAAATATCISAKRYEFNIWAIEQHKLFAPEMGCLDSSGPRYDAVARPLDDWNCGNWGYADDEWSWEMGQLLAGGQPDWFKWNYGDCGSPYDFWHSGGGNYDIFVSGGDGNAIGHCWPNGGNTDGPFSICTTWLCGRHLECVYDDPRC